MNMVVGGEYKCSPVCLTLNGKLYIKYVESAHCTEKIMLNGDTIDKYTILKENEKSKLQNGLARGAVGGAVFGIAGAVIGAASAKNKSEYMIEVKFKDGKHSVLEIDDAIYKAFIDSL